MLPVSTLKLPLLDFLPGYRCKNAPRMTSMKLNFAWCALNSLACSLVLYILFQDREVDLLAKEFELAKERQAEFLGDR